MFRIDLNTYNTSLCFILVKLLERTKVKKRVDNGMRRSQQSKTVRIAEVKRRSVSEDLQSRIRKQIYTHIYIYTYNYIIIKRVQIQQLNIKRLFGIKGNKAVFELGLK